MKKNKAKWAHEEKTGTHKSTRRSSIETHVHGIYVFGCQKYGFFLFKAWKVVVVLAPFF